MAVDEQREHRWLGKSVERVEDERFVRGKGNYVDDIVLPGMLHMAILRSPFAHARILSIDTSRAQALAGRRRRRHRRAAGGAQPRLDADALRRHPGRARDRQGAHAGPGGRVRRRRDAVRRARRARADRRRLRAAAGVTTPQQALEAGAPIIRDDKEGQADNRVYHWESGDMEATDAAFADADRVVALETHYPRSHPVSARVLRLRRGRQPGDGAGDDLHDLAGAARAPHRLRARRRPARSRRSGSSRRTSAAASATRCPSIPATSSRPPRRCCSAGR